MVALAAAKAVEAEASDAAKASAAAVEAAAEAEASRPEAAASETATESSVAAVSESSAATWATAAVEKAAEGSAVAVAAAPVSGTPSSTPSRLAVSGLAGAVAKRRVEIRARARCRVGVSRRAALIVGAVYAASSSAAVGRLALRVDGGNKLQTYRGAFFLGTKQSVQNFTLWLAVSAKVTIVTEG